MQDTAPAHNSNLIKEFLAKKWFVLHLSSSPDLNIVEINGAILKIKSDLKHKLPWNNKRKSWSLEKFGHKIYLKMHWIMPKKFQAVKQAKYRHT